MEHGTIELKGELYEILPGEPTQEKVVYLNSQGSGMMTACGSSDVFRYPLLKIPPTDPRAVKWRLGEAVFNSVEPELRPLITADYRRAIPGETLIDAGGNVTQTNCGTGWNYIILSPPAPEPKTDRELLAEAVIEIRPGNPLREEIRKHLADTE